MCKCNKWIEKIAELPRKDLIVHRYACKWRDIMDELFGWELHDDYKRYLSPFVCRGMKDIEYDLATSLQVSFKDEVLKNGNKELVLINNFKKFAKEHIHNQYDSEILWMIIGRHYELPTRVLDWSGSPYVALYNATSHIYDYCKPKLGKKYSDLKNAVVWCVNIDLLHEVALPKEIVYKMKSMRSRGFTPDALLNIGVENLTDYDCLYSKYNTEMESLPLCMILDPPMIDQRIVNQQACFTMQTRKEDGEYPQFSDDLFEYAKRLHRLKLENKYPLVTILEIDKDLILRTADYLEQSNICHRVLYPGIDGVAKTLMKRYLEPPDEMLINSK